MNRKNYTISEIVDRSEDIVNMALKEKNISKELLPYLYISFASFYMYYGSEYLNTIYSVYKDSSFLFSKSSNVLTNYMAPAFFEIDDIRDTIKDKVLIKESKDSNLVLHSTIHEINHLINSKRNRLSMKNSYFSEDFIRIGAQVRGIKSGTINNFYINELFNSYEAEDIEKMMYRFIYPHKDEFKNSQVKKVFNETGPISRFSSYQKLQTRTNYIFKYKPFYSRLKHNLINGDLEGIDTLFKDSFGYSFRSYASRVESIGKAFVKKK